jgi:hypothetical protein
MRLKIFNSLAVIALLVFAAVLLSSVSYGNTDRDTRYLDQVRAWSGSPTVRP